MQESVSVLDMEGAVPVRLVGSEIHGFHTMAGNIFIIIYMCTCIICVAIFDDIV